MEQFLTMFGNYKTTLVGFIAALVVYEAGVGNKLPASRQEWWALALSVIAQALGLVSKDATTGSKPLLVLLACGLAAGGCALSPSADFIGALGKDPASVCVKVATIYGTVSYARTAIVDGNVTCNGDGLTVKSNGATLGVPMTIVPQVSIGQPTMKP